MDTELRNPAEILHQTKAHCNRQISSRVPEDSLRIHLGFLETSA